MAYYEPVLKTNDRNMTNLNKIRREQQKQKQQQNNLKSRNSNAIDKNYPHNKVIKSNHQKVFNDVKYSLSEIQSDRAKIRALEERLERIEKNNSGDKNNNSNDAFVGEDNSMESNYLNRPSQVKKKSNKKSLKNEGKKKKKNIFFFQSF